METVFYAFDKANTSGGEWCRVRFTTHSAAAIAWEIALKSGYQVTRIKQYRDG